MERKVNFIERIVVERTRTLEILKIFYFKYIYPLQVNHGKEKSILLEKYIMSTLYTTVPWNTYADVISVYCTLKV